MFRPVRKKKNAISDEAAKRLLHTERRGVLAVNGDDGYPYAVPLSYVCDAGSYGCGRSGILEGFERALAVNGKYACRVVYVAARCGRSLDRVGYGTHDSELLGSVGTRNLEDLYCVTYRSLDHVTHLCIGQLVGHVGREA